MISRLPGVRATDRPWRLPGVELVFGDFMSLLEIVIFKLRIAL